MKLTPLKAIKQYCREQCCVEDNDSWKSCNNKNCALFCFRFGKRGIRALPEQTSEKNSSKTLIKPENLPNKIEVMIQ